MAVVYPWCGEECLCWAEPATGSTALHTAADRGHLDALVWLLTRCGNHSQRGFDVRKLCNKFGESPVELCQRCTGARAAECLRAMEVYLGCELEGAGGSEGGRATGVVVLRTYNSLWLLVP